MKKNRITAVGVILAMMLAACGQKTVSNGTATTTVTTAAMAAEDETTETVSENAATVSSEYTAEALHFSQAEVMPGGWTAYESIAPEDHPEAVAAFEKAIDRMTGYRYDLVSVLGSQVVAGMNYACLCRGQAVTPKAAPEYVIVHVYEDLQGHAEITEINECM